MRDEGSRSGLLAENIVHFARVLRRAGIPLGPASVVDAVRAVEVAGIARRDDFYWTLHSIFATRRDQHATFDEAFRLFWRSRQQLRHMLNAPLADEEEREPAAPRAAATRVAEALFDAGLRGRTRHEEEPDIDARLTSSADELLRRRDFAQMSAGEMAAAEAALQKMRLPDDRVPTRRAVAAPPPGSVDLRRTIRASLRTGGGMIALRHRRPAEIHPPIVVLADISGSMAAYGRVLLHFFHAIGRSRRVHTFLFGTRLTNVTRELRRRDPDEASPGNGTAQAAALSAVDFISAPAYILDRAWNALRWNAAARHLFAGWLDGSAERNLLRFIFLEPAARSFISDYRTRARRVVAEFRADVSSHLGDPEIRDLVAELERESGPFSRYWREHAVLGREGGERTFHHPTDGFLRYEQVTFALVGRPDLKLTILTQA